MRILVTGACGFIASRLISELQDQHEIISLDKKEAKHPGIPHFQFDISDPELLNLDLGPIDLIYHTAAQSGGYYSLNNPYEDCLWNSVGTMNVVKLAQKLKVKKLVYTSSMAVYGDMENATEQDHPNPISFYGTSKLSGEYYVKLLNEHANIPYTIFRLFATYGAGQDLENKHQGILSIYLDQAINGDEVRITGATDRVRELVHVSDVVNALKLAAEGEVMNNEIYNVTYSERLSPGIIIEAIGERLGKDLNIKVIDGYVGDQVLITGSNEKLKAVGWEPKVDLNQGIEEFVNSLK